MRRYIKPIAATLSVLAFFCAFQRLEITLRDEAQAAVFYPPIPGSGGSFITNVFTTNSTLANAQGALTNDGAGILGWFNGFITSSTAGIQTNGGSGTGNVFTNPIITGSIGATFTNLTDIISKSVISGPTHTVSLSNGNSTVTYVLDLTNVVAGTAGVAEFSPATHWGANGWKTGVPANSTVEFRNYVLSTTNNAGGYGYWSLERSLNGLAFNPLNGLTFDTVSVLGNTNGDIFGSRLFSGTATTAGTVLIATKSDGGVGLLGGGNFLIFGVTGGGGLQFNALTNASGAIQLKLQDTVNGNTISLTTSNIAASTAYIGNETVTNGLTNLSLTASTMLQSDANKKIISVANGAGILTNNGAGVFGFSPSVSVTQATVGVLILTNPPVLNLQSSTNLFGENVIYNTNANDSATMQVGKYSLLVTNNNVALATSFLAGAFASTNINWSVLRITNTTATAITLTVPNTCTTADGARTYFITNAGIFSVMAYGNLSTNGVCRNNFY